MTRYYARFQLAELGQFLPVAQGWVIRAVLSKQLRPCQLHSGYEELMWAVSSALRQTTRPPP
eukprot:4017641-Prorocentrum_lima.AAC.1